jgi:hypothetical protein
MVLARPVRFELTADGLVPDALVGGPFRAENGGPVARRRRSRLARAGADALVLGTVAIVLGHALSVPARAQTWDDAGAQVAGAAFAIGSVLTVTGFVVTGVTTVQARRWTGLRAWLPAAGAAASAALLALQSTPLLPTAVGLYALSFLALGLALDAAPAPSAAVAAPVV